MVKENRICGFYGEFGVEAMHLFGDVTVNFVLFPFMVALKFWN